MAIVYISKIRKFVDGWCLKEDLQVFGDLGRAEWYQKGHKIDTLREDVKAHWTSDEPNMIRSKYYNLQYDIDEMEIR